MKDRHEELVETITSVFKQTYLPREVVIVDDYSEPAIDQTTFPDMPEGVSIKLCRNEVNIGGAASINRAVEKATSSLIAFLDSDDIWLPRYLENVVKFWETAPDNTVCVATGFYWCTDDLVPYRVQVAPETVNRQGVLVNGNNVGGFSVLSAPRDLFLKKGGCPILRGHHDTGLMLRLTEDGVIRTIQKPLILYRSPTTNKVATYTKKYRKQLLAMMAVYRSHTPEEQALMKPRIRKMVSFLLALMGKKRMAWKLAQAFVFSKALFSPSTIKFLFLLAAGPKIYDGILYYYAHIRARLFGKSLLKKNQTDV